MTSSIKLLALLLLLAATVSAQSSPLEDCVRTFNAQTDCFKTKSTTSGAKLFSVEYKNYYKVVTVNAPFKAPTNYTLVIRGAPRDGLPTNVNGTFDIPVRSVATFDTTTVPFVELLGRRSTIKAASSPEYVSSPCFQKLLADGQIAKVDEKNATSSIAALESIDAIFSGLGPTTGTLGQGKWVTQSASSDPGTFNRAEWLEYFAQWYGLEGEAETMTNQIKARYDAVKEAAAKAKPTNPTKLAWVMYSAPASWNENVASWSFSLSAFKKQVVEDASATFTAPATASYKDAAEFRKQLADVDVIVWESFTSGDMAAFKKEFGVDDTFKFVKNNQVYALDKRTNPSAFLDWFESALVFPNVILQDIVAITNPAVKNVQRTYLRKVDAEKPTVLTKDQCTGDANAAMPVMGLSDAEIKSTIVAAPGNSASVAQGKVAAVVAAGVAAVAMIVA